MQVNHSQVYMIIFAKDVNKTFLPSLHIGGLSFDDERCTFLHSAQCIQKELQYTEINKNILFSLSPPVRNQSLLIAIHKAF